MSSLHPALIHFPIALLAAAVLMDAVWFVRRRTDTSSPALPVLLLGMVGTLFAFVCGNFAEVFAARAGVPQAALEQHELAATLTSWSFVALTAWRMLMPKSGRRWVHGVWLVLAAFAVAGILYTGHLGGDLVYGYGANVRGLGMRSVPTEEQLTLLASKQDADSIYYSDQMHHIFGWMVLLLSLLLVLDQTAPELGMRLRVIGPPLLLAGGIFLMIFSDQDAWPLYHIKPYRPITDKEVLMHKVYAVLLLLLGWRGMALMRRGRSEGAAKTIRIQDRWMAVFALVGGAMLFTHVHSGAPYANVAVGVYIHHTALGLLALAVGAVKLLDDALGRESLVRRRAYPALMCVTSLFLINYNEGLPWFLGYGRMSTIGPNGGLVAPMGPHRAELRFDPVAAKLTMQLFPREGKDPLVPPAPSADAVITVGGESTALPLHAEGRLYTASAPFLRQVPLFCAQVSIRQNGSRYTADFEPWVDPSQVRRLESAFVCPMHPAEGSGRPDVCRLCGMPMEPALRLRPADVLHDDDFRMELSTVPGRIEAGKETTLRFRAAETKSGRTAALRTVHEHPLHLILVRRDLGWFEHLHPQPTEADVLEISCRFPTGGDYLLYADCTPVGSVNQVFRLPLHVEGPDAVRSEVSVADHAQFRVFGDYRVGLRLSPEVPSAPGEAVLTVTVTKNGLPVSDLGQWMGASGHCVLISRDTKQYIHSHPVQRGTEPGSGPQIDFHTRFPKPGPYKVWVQFNHAGSIHTVDFSIDVR